MNVPFLSYTDKDYHLLIAAAEERSLAKIYNIEQSSDFQIGSQSFLFLETSVYNSPICLSFLYIQQERGESHAVIILFATNTNFRRGGMQMK